MGCNCGGSQQPAATFDPARAVAREPRNIQQPPVLRGGGPGEPGYVWNGPETPPEAPAEDQ